MGVNNREGLTVQTEKGTLFNLEYLQEKVREKYGKQINSESVEILTASILTTFEITKQLQYEVVKYATNLIDYIRFGEDEGYMLLGKDMQRVMKILYMTVLCAVEEKKVKDVADILAVMMVGQFKDKKTFLHRYLKEAKRLFMTLSEYIDYLVDGIVESHNLSKEDCVRFLYFMWAEYQTTPPLLGNQGLQLYVREFKVFNSSVSNLDL